jgi:hypothetical protein
MKLFDRFNKKPATTQQSASIEQPTGDRNFVDDLVTYFSSKPEVTAAYLGFGYNSIDKQYHLFLAVDHEGKAESISKVASTIKSVYMNDTPIGYVSPLHDGDTLEYISQHNPPFYHKDDPALLQQKIIKQWFNEKKYKQELTDTLKQSELFFATYVRPAGEFVPLFTTHDMIAKSGITEIPAGKVAMKMPFEMILKMLNREQFFLLNPGTPFEVELRV